MSRTNYARLLAAAAGLAIPVLPVGADPLNPLDFEVLREVEFVPGTYTIDTSAGTMTGPGVSLVGTYHADNVLVFSFETLTVPKGVKMMIEGRRPVALLAVGDLKFAGCISHDGGNGAPGTGLNAPGAGGEGDACGGTGLPPGSAGCPSGGVGGAPMGVCGGSFGGLGFGAVDNTYGNLLLRLEGGSGGTGSVATVHGAGSGGGAGGGAIELGSLATLDIDGAAITANGGAAGYNGTLYASGGAGGGVLLHGAIVNIGSGAVSADGGVSGGAGPGNGGGGGGGRIAVQSTNDITGVGLCVNPGGTGDHSGSPGVITTAQVRLGVAELDFGDVDVGAWKVLWLGTGNLSDPDTSINGQFPEAAPPFMRFGDGVFSGFKPGRFSGHPYFFQPEFPGEFTQQLTILSNAGPVNVTLRGTGIGIVTCYEDLNSDGIVNTADLTAILSRFGVPCYRVHCAGDINGDGRVDTADLTRLLARFGWECPRR